MGIAQGKSCIATRWGRHLWLLAAIMCQQALRPSTANGQAEMSASLARILAETADIHDGQPHWIVAEPSYPHRITGIFPTLDAARAAVRPGSPSRIFGPFVTPLDFGRPPLIMAYCMHLASPIASVYEPTGGPYCPGRVFPADSIDQIRVFIRTKQGDTLTVDVKNADSIFLTATAIQKFVLPYYSRVYGPGYAKTLWDSVTARVGRLP